MTLRGSPFSRRRVPGAWAPTVRTTWVNPWSLSSCTPGASWPVRTSTSIFCIRATSQSTLWSGMRNSGTT